jgi:hypothetical protein
MSNDNYRALREAIERRASDPEKMWQSMIDRGAIDQEGNVLLRRPDASDNRDASPPASGKKR